MRLDFIGIGPGKSGTTWLYNILKSHPQVAMSKVKETNFFNDNFHRGQDWYFSLFPDEADGFKIGEISNTYIFSPDAAIRIHSTLPDVKLFSVLRDPIERAISHYLFLIRNGAPRLPFNTAIQSRPDLLSRGLYFSHLSSYLDLFNRDNVFLGIFDDIKLNPQGFADQLFQFLEISSVDVTKLRSEKLQAAMPKSRHLASAIKKIAVAVRSTGHPVVIEKVKQLRIFSKLYTPITYSTDEMLGSNKAQLIEYYLEDVRLLSDVIGRDLEKLWLEKYATCRVSDEKI